MKGKRFIVIMAIFLMLCSIQATTAFENNNLNQADAIIVDNVQFSDIVEDSSNEQISDIGGPNNLTGDVANVELSHFVDTSSGISIGSSNIVGVNSQNILGISSENLLEIGNEDKLGITAGTFIYGVDYDQSRVGDDVIPLYRFFKAIFWGIRDYMKNNPSATREWDVFLNNKTFSSNYGSGAIETGYSLYGDRVRYLALNGLGGYDGAENVALTIHLYGGATKDDGLTSTLDLSGYSVNYALLDFGTGNSTITGVNFKNFDVNKQASTRDPDTTVPFIILGDASDSAENRIQNCTFENIILNPRQPLYQNGNLIGEYDIIKDYYNNQKYLYNDDPVEFADLVKGIFYGVTSSIRSKNPITTWNVYLHNKTYTGLYDTSNMIETGLNDWANPFPAHYITFKGYNDLNITVHLYGGCTPTDNKKINY